MDTWSAISGAAELFTWRGGLALENSRKPFWSSPSTSLFSLMRTVARILSLKHVLFLFRCVYTPSMSYKHIGTAADLVRFGCSLRIECGRCFAANTLSAIEVAQRCGPAISSASAPVSNVRAAARNPRAWWYCRPFRPYFGFAGSTTLAEITCTG
jgi:hypothetical protein